MYDMVDSLPGAFRLKMPPFTVAWTIVDLVLSSVRALELPFLAAALILLDAGTGASDLKSRLFLVLAAELIPAALIGIAGIAGNIALLCRRRWGLPLCAAEILFTFLSCALMVWQAAFLCRGSSVTVLCWVVLGVTLILMLRAALLVFNLLSLVKAAGFFRRRGF